MKIIGLRSSRGARDTQVGGIELDIIPVYIINPAWNYLFMPPQEGNI